MKTKTNFFNERAASVASAELIVFGNEASLQADGWAHLAPFGDFPGTAVIKNRDGSIQEFDAIQRLDRSAAQSMAEKFRSPWHKLKRYLTGCWIFNGHPDMPNAGNKYPDPQPKGIIADLEVRADGLYCLPVFTNEGRALLNQGAKLFFSGRWTSDELPAENGRRIFRPDQLKSAGLTTRPNLPVHHANDQTAHDLQIASDQSQPTTNMQKKIIINLLTAQGFTFANDATDDQLADALKQLSEKASLAGQLAQEKAAWFNEKSALESAFANERTARIQGLLDAAITAGRITAAERSGWERRLADLASFANESDALARLARAIKTTSLVDGAGQRKLEIANVSQRRDAVQTLVTLEMDRAKCGYDAAYAKVQRENPALFEAMQQPKTL